MDIPFELCQSSLGIKIHLFQDTLKIVSHKSFFNFRQKNFLRSLDSRSRNSGRSGNSRTSPRNPVKSMKKRKLKRFYTIYMLYSRGCILYKVPYFLGSFSMYEKREGKDGRNKQGRSSSIGAKM